MPTLSNPSPGRSWGIKFASSSCKEKKSKGWGFALFFLFFFLSFAPCEGAVSVRAAAHQDFGRIVFDFTKTPPYQTHMRGQNLIIDFSSPVELNFRGMESGLFGYFSAPRLENGGLRAVFPLADATDFQAYQVGPLLVLDLRDKTAMQHSAAKPPSPPKGRTPETLPENIALADEGAGDSFAGDSPAGSLGEGLGGKDLREEEDLGMDLEEEDLGMDLGEEDLGMDLGMELSDMQDPVQQDPGPKEDSLAEDLEMTTPKIVGAGIDTAIPDHILFEESQAEDSTPKMDGPGIDAAIPDHILFGESQAENSDLSDAEGSRKTLSSENLFDLDPMAGGLGIEQPLSDSALPNETENSSAQGAIAENLLPEDLTIEDSGTSESLKKKDSYQELDADSAIADLILNIASQEEDSEEASQEPEVKLKELSSLLEETKDSIVTILTEKEASRTFSSRVNLRILVSGAELATLAAGNFTQVMLDFGWKSRVAASAFVLDRKIWVLFSKPLPLITQTQITSSLSSLNPQFREVDQGAGTAIIFDAPPAIIPSLERGEKNHWKVTLAPGYPTRKSEVTLRPYQDSPQSPEVLRYKVIGAGPTLQIDDPEKDRKLYVVTFFEPVPSRQLMAFPQFMVLPSYYGLLFQVLDKNIQVDSDQAYVWISHPEKILHTQKEYGFRGWEQLEKQNPETRLFHLNAWRRRDLGDFQTARNKLLRNIVAAQEDQAFMRLEYLQFFFANGFFPEALGIAETILEETPRFSKDLQLQGIVGAILSYLGRIEEAEPFLEKASASGSGDVEIWQGFIEWQRENWWAAAVLIGKNLPILLEYPPMIRDQLRIAGVESMLESKNFQNAGAALQSFKKVRLSRTFRAMGQYLEGLYMHLQGYKPQAKLLFRKAASSDNRLARAKSTLALLTTYMQEGKIPLETARSLMERTRFTWRGDFFEYKVLLRLGELYEREKNYLQALRIYEIAALKFPLSYRGRVALLKMQKLFSEIFISERGDSLEPLVFLAIYEEFNDLIPPGYNQSRIIYALIQKLQNLDLLKRAIDLLEANLPKLAREKDVDLFRLSTLLARLKIDSNLPKEALSALTPFENVTLETREQEALHLLRAEAFASQKDWNKAMQALDIIPFSSRVFPLAVRIAQESESWERLSEFYEKIAPDPEKEPFTTKDRKHVLAWAVALNLSDNSEKQQELYQNYRENFYSTPESSLFELLTREIAAQEAPNITTLLESARSVEELIDAYQKEREEKQTTEADLP